MTICPERHRSQSIITLMAISADLPVAVAERLLLLQLQVLATKTKLEKMFGSVTVHRKFNESSRNSAVESLSHVPFKSSHEHIGI